jgi:hypothetical protein
MTIPEWYGIDLMLSCQLLTLLLSVLLLYLEPILPIGLAGCQVWKEIDLRTLLFQHPTHLLNSLLTLKPVSPRGLGV